MLWPQPITATLRPMRRLPLLTRLFAVLMALSMLPGWGEVFESAEHLVHYGHLPHSAVHELHAGQEAPHHGPVEHGCNPLFHPCGAHGVKAVVGAGVSVPAPVLFLVTRKDAPLVAEGRLADLYRPPPTPPPIA